MDEQMIAEIEAALAGESSNEGRARAAHSVMSARLAELEEALRAAIDMIDDAARDGGYSLSELAGLRAALAPHPKAHE